MVPGPWPDNLCTIVASNAPYRQGEGLGLRRNIFPKPSVPLRHRGHLSWLSRIDPSVGDRDPGRPWTDMFDAAFLTQRFRKF